VLEKKKVLLIPGGSGSLGKSLLKKYKDSEYECVVIDRDRESLALCQKEFPKVKYLESDLVEEEDVKKVLENIFGQSHVVAVVNMIGWIFTHPLIKFEGGKVHTHSVDDWNKVIQLNLAVPFMLTLHSAAQMTSKRTKGVIVNVSSICAQGNMGQVAYSAAKAGLETLSVTVAKELGPLGIRCVCLSPGFIETGSTLAALNENGVARIKSETPLRRLGTPAEFADAVGWIIENKFFNGKVLPLDGGLNL
jgi:3-oxoacyl-[acyl-carrier protein] reductase